MSGTQYNKDPYQVRPEHRLHDSNEPLQSTTTTGVTDTSMPPTGQYGDPQEDHQVRFHETNGSSQGTSPATTGVTDTSMPPTSQYRDPHQVRFHETNGSSQGTSPATTGVTDTSMPPTSQYRDPQEDHQVRFHETNGSSQGTSPATTGVTDTSMPQTGQYHVPHHDPSGVSDEYNTTQGRAAAGKPGQLGQEYDTYFTTSPSGNTPLNAKPQDGVAYGGQCDLPVGYADLGDKIIGKTQKVVGKMTNNPELHEKGELRKSGGRAAVHGLARVPQD